MKKITTAVAFSALIFVANASATVQENFPVDHLLIPSHVDAPLAVDNTHNGQASSLMARVKYKYKCTRRGCKVKYKSTV